MPTSMKNETKRLMGELENCDLSLAAFHLVKNLKDGVFKEEIVAALDLFTRLPCPETAVNLISAWPETIEIMKLSQESLGPAIEGYEQRMKLIRSNLRTTTNIQTFLLKEATAGRVRIGFHRLRDQTSLLRRLDRIGIRKGLFKNSRQFLRDAIAMNQSAFRAVIDMICIEGLHDGRTKFWNGLGQEADAQIYFQTEVMFEIGLLGDAFVEILEPSGHP